MDNIKEYIKNYVENYPDLNKLLEEGRLSHKSGWYEIKDDSIFDLIAPYVTEIKVKKDKMKMVKISKQSTNLQKLTTKI